MLLHLMEEMLATAHLLHNLEEIQVIVHHLHRLSSIRQLGIAQRVE
jgi:hypothetical protein